MKKLKRNWRKLTIALFVLLLAGEWFARFVLGLGHLPVYIEDPDYEYIYAPNQNLYRFGHHVQTNSLSMRSKELSDKDVLRILKFGDSVINGGAHIDQDSLSTTLLEDQLSDHFSKQIRVLNISAQSWGPDNAFAYLKKHGGFGSKYFVLVFSSHDFHDNMHFRKVVGEHKAWPSSQPWCALTDGFNRYFWPGVKKMFGGKDEEYDYLYDFDDSRVNTGWQNFVDYTQQHQIHLLVYVHPELPELKAGEYNQYGKELIDFLDYNKVGYLRGLEVLNDPSLYRDNIHLNEKGHRKLAEILYPYFEKEVKVLLEP